MEGRRAIFCVLALGFLGAMLLYCAQVFRMHSTKTEYGFTFSSMYAESLGLSAEEALVASIDAFHPAFIRFPLYWDTLQPEEATFSWEQTDILVARMTAAQVPLHMVIGAKVPRWPECFVPDWVHTQDTERFRDELLAYETAVIQRYAPVVDVWQVENEPFFTFGDCPKPDISFLQQEISLVRSIDPSAQVQMTVSGEQQMWSSVASLADRIGVSIYRNVRSAFFGALVFPTPSWWYILMRIPVSFTHTVVVSELQMEPWFTSHPRYFPLEEAAELFTVQDALHNLAFARATGFSEVSLWGVEWWYYLQQHGYPALWDAMKEEIGQMGTDNNR